MSWPDMVSALSYLSFSFCPGSDTSPSAHTRPQPPSSCAPPCLPWVVRALCSAQAPC
jgi:hypothetical protein